MVAGVAYATPAFVCHDALSSLSIFGVENLDVTAIQWVDLIFVTQSIHNLLSNIDNTVGGLANTPAA